MKRQTDYLTGASRDLSKRIDIIELNSDEDVEELKDKINELVEKKNPKSIITYKGKGLVSEFDNASFDILYFIENCLEYLAEANAQVYFKDGDINLDGGKDNFYSLVFSKITPEEVEKKKGIIPNDKKIPLF